MPTVGCLPDVQGQSWLSWIHKLQFCIHLEILHPHYPKQLEAPFIAPKFSGFVSVSLGKVMVAFTHSCPFKDCRVDFWSAKSPAKVRNLQLSCIEYGNFLQQFMADVHFIDSDEHWLHKSLFYNYPHDIWQSSSFCLMQKWRRGIREKQGQTMA